jgi:hypothetical protein
VVGILSPGVSRIGDIVLIRKTGILRHGGILIKRREDRGIRPIPGMWIRVMRDLHPRMMMRMKRWMIVLGIMLHCQPE